MKIKIVVRVEDDKSYIYVDSEDLKGMTESAKENYITELAEEYARTHMSSVSWKVVDGVL